MKWSSLLRLWSSPRTVLRSVLALDDTSHAIALGVAIGVLVGLTPTVGLQTGLVVVIVGLTRRLFYFNRAAALLTIYISNPLTLVPIYYGLYWTGCQLVPGDVSRQQLGEILTFHGLEGWWLALRELVLQVGWPLLIGTLLVAPLSAVLSYPATLFLIRWARGQNGASAAENGPRQPIANGDSGQRSDASLSGQGDTTGEPPTDHDPSRSKSWQNQAAECRSR